MKPISKSVAPFYARVIAELTDDQAKEYLVATGTMLEGWRRAGSVGHRNGHPVAIVRVAEVYHDVGHKNHLLSMRVGNIDDQVERIASGKELPYAGGPGDDRNIAAVHVAMARQLVRGRWPE